MKKCSIDGCLKMVNSHGLCGMHGKRVDRHGDPHYKKDIKGLFENVLDLYWSRIKINPNTDCWEYTGPKTGFGYGVICFNGKQQDTHRFAYKKFIGPIPDGMFVLHKCDQPACSNPDHLFVGTQKDNMQDCILKLRFKKVDDKYKCRGSNHVYAKLDEHDVKEIKKLLSNGETNVQIAEKFNVTHKNISCIKLGKTWKHIE